jgi:hypothetical protein
VAATSSQQEHGHSLVLRGVFVVVDVLRVPHIRDQLRDTLIAELNTSPQIPLTIDDAGLGGCVYHTTGGVSDDEIGLYAQRQNDVAMDTTTRGWCVRQIIVGWFGGGATYWPTGRRGPR